MSETTTKTLAELGPGDPVVIESWGPGRSTEITTATVGRTTATRIIVDGTAYRRKDGRRVELGRWSTPYLKPYSPEMTEVVVMAEQKQRHSVLADRLYDIGRGWDKLPLSKLERIAAILDEP